MRSLGATSKAETSRAFVVESPGSEEGDVGARLDEPVGKQLHDGLDSAVAIGGDGEPDGAEERDVHYFSSTTMVPFLTSTDQTRPTARIPSSRVPSSQSGARGVEVARTPAVGSGRRPRSSVRQRTGAPAAHACGLAAVG